MELSFGRAGEGQFLVPTLRVQVLGQRGCKRPEERGWKSGKRREEERERERKRQKAEFSSSREQSERLDNALSRSNGLSGERVLVLGRLTEDCSSSDQRVHRF